LEDLENVKLIKKREKKSNNILKESDANIFSNHIGKIIEEYILDQAM